MFNFEAIKAVSEPASNSAEEPTGTWHVETVDSLENVGDFSSLALDSAGRPHISYCDLTNSDLKYASWNGTTWNIQPVVSAGYVLRTCLALDSNDNPHICYSVPYPGYQLKYAVWNGTAWDIQTPDTSNNVGYWAISMTIDSNDRPHICYFDRNSNALKYAYWNGADWTNQVVEGFFADHSLSFSSIAIDSQDKPHISYYYNSSTLPYRNNLKYASWNGATWDIQIVDSSNSVGLGWDNSLALDSADRPRISYAGGGDFRYTEWNGTAWNTQEVDPANGNSGTGSSLALDSGDNPHITCCKGSNLVYYWRNGATWNLENIDSNAQDPSLRTADNPHVSYYDNTNGDLKYATKLGSSTLSLDGVASWLWGTSTVVNSQVSADVDGDGAKELVTGGNYFDGTRNVAQIVIWNASTLTAEKTKAWYWTANTTINSLAIGDVNGDGQTEIVTAGSYFDNSRNVAQLVVWNGSSLEAENIKTWYWTGDTTINSVAIGDVDGDGQTEIVTAGNYFDGTRNNAQLVEWNGANLTVDRLKSWYWTGNTVINSVAVGDADNDDQIEIVTGGYYNDGTRNVAQIVEWAGTNLSVDRVKAWYWTSNTVVNSVAIGDADDDGQTEVITGGYYNDGTRNNAQLVEWSGSTLTVDRLTGWYWTENTSINSIAIGDADSDGQAELVSAGQFNDGSRDVAQLVVWSGSSLEIEDLKSWYWTGRTSINTVAISDVDNDFSKEIVAGGAFNDATHLNSQLSVWRLTYSPLYKVDGLDFSPYILEGQNPDMGTVISEAQIRNLLARIQPYTRWVRTFGCSNGLEVVGSAAHELGLKAAIGAWIGSDLSANEKEIANLIAIGKAGQADLLIVGSEVLYRGDVSASQLIDYINTVKAAVPTIPVATADTYGELLAHQDVVDAGDVVLPNLYPYWEGVNVSYAVSFLNIRYQQIVSAAKGKPIIVSESGWPSGGNQVGDAVPSPQNAAFYFQNFVSWARAENATYFYFAAFDEPWKVANEGLQGAHWGVWDGNVSLKAKMKNVFDNEIIKDNWNGNATIEFTYVPPYGSFDNLKGQVLHVVPEDYRVAVYIKVGSGWWTKPYFSDPLTSINPNGSWICDITTGGSDQTATEIAAYLFKAGYNPPQCNGQSTLPPELEQNANATCRVTRAP
jgi:exo-beta-1,3-glucanase (GH17 family)